ncbi:ABC transporter substrate-binding protein [Roseospira visakhapatnamensis]|uniref:NitT/TauT family transport system substrate-binding protein n=1 Tax=Roseospira visakhapatnamensis TaxID=390880 RepID=A0A7W6W9E3_9PROT|nr:ABC transporter substrate-binding protein [Roseospira visakhapatnamensis]MBB4265728.1 NitT/TauT family transport system substrate-binding protein [Roseospira visakhapatnamensis]
MFRPDRRSFLALSLAGAAATGGGLAPLWPSRAAAGSPVTISGMPSAPSVTLAHAVESGALNGLVDAVDFTIWKTPDQMRAGAISGAMDIFATPSYACANLHNRGVPVRMLNIMTWGLLYVVTTDDTIDSPEDLAGRSLVLAFKDDAPDLIFRLVASNAGLDPRGDIDVTYAGTPMEVVQLLLAGKTDIAVVPEPAATAAILRGRRAGRTVRRAVDLTAELGRQTGRPARIAQAGLGVQEDLVQHRPEVVQAFHDACVRGGQWANNNPASAGRLGQDYLGVKAPIIEKSIPHFRVDVTPSREARADIEFYLNSLMRLNPDIVAGRLPGDGYYWPA